MDGCAMTDAERMLLDRVHRFTWRVKPVDHDSSEGGPHPDEVFEAWADEMPACGSTGPTPVTAMTAAIASTLAAALALSASGAEVPSPLCDAGYVKQVNLKLRVTDFEYLTAAARRAGISLSEFVRQASVPRARPTAQATEDLLLALDRAREALPRIQAEFIPPPAEPEQCTTVTPHKPITDAERAMLLEALDAARRVLEGPRSGKIADSKPGG